MSDYRLIIFILNIGLIFIKYGELVPYLSLKFLFSPLGSFKLNPVHLGNLWEQNSVKLLISCLVKFHKSLQKFTSLLQGKIWSF